MWPTMTLRCVSGPRREEDFCLYSPAPVKLRLTVWGMSATVRPKRCRRPGRGCSRSACRRCFSLPVERERPGAVTVHFIEAVGGVDSSSTGGLTTSEVAERLAVDGPNELPTAKPRNLVQQARDVVRQPMLLLLVGAGNGQLPARRAARRRHPDVVRRRRDRASRSTRSTRPRTRSPRCAISLPRARWSSATAGSSASRAATSCAATSSLLAEGDRVPADAVLVDCVNISRRRVGAHRRVGPGSQGGDRRWRRVTAAMGRAGRRRHAVGVLRHAGREGPRHRAGARRPAAAPSSDASARRCARSNPSARRCSARSTGSSA